MHHIVNQIISLAFQLLFAWLVLRYYKTKTYAVRYKYDTFGPRFWTGTVDAVVMWPIGFLFSLFYLFALPPLVSAIFVVIQNLGWLVYTVVMHAKYGQTVGKMACKVRVIDFATEQAMTVKQAFLREGIPMTINLILVAYEVACIVSGKFSAEAIARGDIVKSSAFWWMSVLPLAWFIAEVLTMLTNDKRRALHDFIAGTVAVRTNLETT